MLVSDFDFDLPERLIAQQPPAERGGARMLALNREGGTWLDRHFRELPELLHAGDVLVLNNSRVIPARLYAQRRGSNVERRGNEDSGQAPSGRVEVLLTEQQSAWEWRALVKPGKKVRVSEQLFFAASDGALGSSLTAEVIEHGDFGERLLRFEPCDDFYERLDTLGHMPLPPYIRRQDTTADRDRYQTVYAQERGSVAAPTAGLHFTPEMLRRIWERGVSICYVTLHVGLGTFQPVHVDTLEEICLHSERYELPDDTAQAINAARREGRRVIAAGTTTVRTLEHCTAASEDGQLHAHAGATSIFISPGFRFRAVDALLTNFHLPQSTLLMLVSAFSGRERTLAAYRHAVEARYNFFSYGDCMFIS